MEIAHTRDAQACVKYRLGLAITRGFDLSCVSVFYVTDRPTNENPYPETSVVGYNATCLHDATFCILSIRPGFLKTGRYNADGAVTMDSTLMVKPGRIRKYLQERGCTLSSCCAD